MHCITYILWNVQLNDNTIIPYATNTTSYNMAYRTRCVLRQTGSTVELTGSITTEVLKHTVMIDSLSNSTMRSHLSNMQLPHTAVTTTEAH